MSVFYNSPLNFRIPQISPKNIADPVVRDALNDVYTALQFLITQTAIPNSQGTIIPVAATETIAYTAAVNLFLNAGVLSVRNANSSVASRMCHGFLLTTGGLIAAQSGLVDTGVRVINYPAGVTIGQNYWLAPINGAIQTTPDTTAGHIEQYIGLGIAANLLLIKPTNWIQH